jgi:hypothetical protein
MPQATPQRLWASYCWPVVSSPHVYKSIAPTHPDVVVADDSWQSSAYFTSSSRRRLAYTSIQYSLLAVAIVIQVIWLGAEYERYHVRNADDTLGFYTQPEVCGIVHSKQANITSAKVTASSRVVAASVVLPETSLRIKTFSSVDEVTAASSSGTNSVVAHCGDCGACSTPQDINIYDETRNTLFKTTTECAKRGLMGGHRAAAKCMMEDVGLTPDCNDCWVENIMCDLRKCIFTCMWYGLFNQVDGGAGGAGTALNPCTECDERRCGPAFVTCAGANRRRSGIISDIKRDEHSEVCHDVTREWWKDQDLQRQWRAQQLVNDSLSSSSVTKSRDKASRLRS